MSERTYRERQAAGDPDGLLVLHHGRGSDETALLALADVVDPRRRLHVVTPRAPLALCDEAGYQWYRAGRVGFPDPTSFGAAYRWLAALHDELWRVSGIDPACTVLGGFSMGSVVSFALGLGPDRPAPAGILAFSGYLPRVEGWQPDLTRRETRVFVAHGQDDELIDVGFGRETRDRLDRAGLDVAYHETESGHTIAPAQIRQAVRWLTAVLPPGA